MKRNYIYGACLGLMTLFATGCEDQLDIAKHGNMGGQDDFYTNDTNVGQAVAAMYNEVLGTEVSVWGMKNYLSDDVHCGGGMRGDNSTSEQLNEYAFGADHATIKGAYSALYTTIYTANLIIDKTNYDSEVAQRAIAEAHFFRAWAHFELVSMWGNVPIVDHLLQPSEYRQSNRKPEEVYAFIISDLEEAVSSNALPSKSSIDDKNTGVRVTKEAAYALLGKAKLFAGDAAGAAAAFENIIGSGLYDLWQGAYRDLFHISGNNCCESILECQVPNDPEKSWDFFMTQMGYYTITGWRTGLMEVDTYNPNMWTYVQGGWGFFNPRKELWDEFVRLEGENGYRKQQIITDYTGLQAYGLKIQAGQSLVGCEGYWFHKHQTYVSDCSTYPFVGFPTFQAINFRLMRYAEVLLLAAEANLAAGNSAKATEYLNKVRARAQEPALASVSLDDIKAEKRLELCMEGVRYQDLLRWGEGAKYMANQGKQVPSCAHGDGSTGNVNPSAFSNPEAGFKAGKHELLPIPHEEIKLNGNMKQNPGW
ncbi:MAG: RagB/SusD family nutrient uptake outer membrane protein [Bacteroidia bacterium]|nr:RagB/SusD family nutrient uptake outer membrane protein [Bacteroidia bacterium]